MTSAGAYPVSSLVSVPIEHSPSNSSCSGFSCSLQVSATSAAVALSVSAGADIVRVHDVAEMRQVADVAAAVRRGRTST